MLRYCVCLGLLVFSCSRQGSEQAYFDREGQAKPIVSVVPLIDHSGSQVGWNLSEELTSGIRGRLINKGKLFLGNEVRAQEVAKKLNSRQNPFSEDLSWLKACFDKEEFVAFFELIEHEEVAGQELASTLNMSVRIRVIDLRESEPQVVLQEIVHDSHFIPKHFNIRWNQEGFGISPMGLAHTQLTQEITKQLEDYILFAK
jgi:hypothetical protein